MVILIREEQVKKLLSDECWHLFVFLSEIAGIRWYRFAEVIGFGDEDFQHESISSKELLYKIAITNKKLKNREKWVEVLSNFDLVFLPDDIKFGKKRLG